MRYDDSIGMRILALAPLLVVTTNASYGLGIGVLVAIMVLLTAKFAIVFRYLLPPQHRLLASILLLAGSITLISRICATYYYPFYLAIGNYFPLISVNCLCFIYLNDRYLMMDKLKCIGHAFAFAPLLILIFTLTGGIRELLGQGTLFADGYLLLALPKTLTFSVEKWFSGVTIFLLPAGALFMLSIFIAGSQCFTRNRC